MAKLKTQIQRFFSWFFSWDLGTGIFAGAFFLTFIAFNVLWCSWTTFTPFSHFPLYVSAVLMSLIFTLPYVICRCRWLEVLLLVLLDFLLLANLMYARTYFNAIPLSSYTNAGNLADFMPSVWASLRWADFVFPVITCVAIWLIVKFQPRIVSEPRTKKMAYLSALAIPVIITLIAFPGAEAFKKQYRYVSNSAYAYRSTPAMYTVFGNLLYDTLVAYEKLTPEEEAATLSFVESLPGIESLPEGVKAPRNLVFVFCESLESWVIGTDYYGQEITPNLNRALRDSATYYNPHVVSQAADGRSIDGQLLNLTGLYPLSSGTYATMYPNNSYPSIHKALKQAHGSRTMLMTGDKEYVWNQGLVARGMGMDTLITGSDYIVEDNFTGRKHIGDRALMRQSVEKLKSRGDLWPVGAPVFLQLVTYSGHGPFRLPDSEKKLKIHPGTPEIMADYMQVAHYTDESLGILIDYLRSRPDWEDTMVVITGDHEGLADWRAECLSSEIGQRMVSKELYVPLVILNSPLPGRSEKVMGQVDVFTSMLHLLGLGNYEWHGLGRSVFSSAHPGTALSAQGQPVGGHGGVPDSVTEGLRMARKVSGNLIRYDMLNSSKH